MWVVQNVTVVYSVKLVLERAFDSSICCVITDHVTFPSSVGRFDLCVLRIIFTFNFSVTFQSSVGRFDLCTCWYIQLKKIVTLTFL